MAAAINYQVINELISSGRLSSYNRVFNTTGNEDAISVYIWNTELCSSLYSLLNIVEICLRNAIDKSFYEEYGSHWWSVSKLKFLSFVPGDTPPTVINDIQTGFTNAFHSVRSEKKHRYNLTTYQPTHQEIVAKTDFYMWECFLDNEFMGDKLIWPKKLKSVFKGNWNTNPSKFLTETKELINYVRLLRNRVSHNEPIWKKHGIRNEASALTFINEVIGKIEKLIDLISPEITNLICFYELLDKAKLIATKDVLDAYRAKPAVTLNEPEAQAAVEAEAIQTTESPLINRY